MTVSEEKVLPIITIEDEEYARSAFVAAMQENGVLVNFDQVSVRQRRNGDLSYLLCLAESPDHSVNPYAVGAFYGNASGGRVHIMDFLDPKSNWWRKPEPKLAWHHFTGTIESVPPETMPSPIRTQAPFMDVWFDPSA